MRTITIGNRSLLLAGMLCIAMAYAAGAQDSAQVRTPLPGGNVGVAWEPVKIRTAGGQLMAFRIDDLSPVPAPAVAGTQRCTRIVAVDAPLRRVSDTLVVGVGNTQQVSAGRQVWCIGETVTASVTDPSGGLMALVQRRPNGKPFALLASSTTRVPVQKEPEH